MSDLIDREALLDSTIYVLDKAWTAIGVVIADRIRSAPAIDAVEVVRCKDCKHWGNTAFFYVCRYWSGIDMIHHTNEDCFCSYGERRGE